MAKESKSRERFPDLSESEILTEHQEMRLVKNPTRVETYRNAIRPSVNVLPPNPLPRWKNYPLEQKFPIIPAPAEEFVFARNAIGEDIYVSSRKTKFDNEDPQIQATPKGYTSLHDRNLKDYFESHPNVFEAVVDQGLVDPSDGGVNASKKEFNTYRAYLGRLRNNTVKDDLRFQDALGKAQLAQSYRIRQFDRREGRVEKDERKRRYLEAFMKDKKARQLSLRLKEKERSLAYCESKSKEEAERAVKREKLRQEVKSRIVKLRRAERRRARRILLEWYCRQLYADMMRKALAEHKKTSREANLESFIKSKREFQKSRMKYTHALEQRKFAERECRQNRRMKHFEHIEENRLEICRQKELEKQRKADREEYLLRKFGMRWLSVVRNQMEYKKSYHDSVWRVRQNLIDMVRNLKQESGKVSFTNFIQGLVSLKPGKQAMPTMTEETRSIMNYILDLLIKAAFDTYQKSNRPCAHAYEGLANRRRILGQKNLKPDDFKQPPPHFRAIPVVPFYRPLHPYPCGDPCIEEREEKVGKCLEDEMIADAEQMVHEELKRVAKKYRDKKKTKPDKVIVAAMDKAIKSLEPVHRDIPPEVRKKPVKDVSPKPHKVIPAAKSRPPKPKPLKRVDRVSPSGGHGESVIAVPSEPIKVISPPKDRPQKPSERVVSGTPSRRRPEKTASETSSETDKVITSALGRASKSLESIDREERVHDVPSEPDKVIPEKSLESVDHGTPSEGPGESVTDSSLEPDNVIASAIDVAKKSLKTIDHGTTPSKSRVDGATDVPSKPDNVSTATSAPIDVPKKSLETVDHGTTPEIREESVIEVPSQPDNVIATPVDRSKKSLETVDHGTIPESPKESVTAVPSEPIKVISPPKDRPQKPLERAVSGTPSGGDSSSVPDNVTATALNRAIKSLECVDGEKSVSCSSSEPDNVTGVALDRAIESLECADRGESVSCSSSDSDKVVASALDRAIKSLECVDRGSAAGSSSDSDKVVGTALDRAIESFECVDRGESCTGSSSQPEKVVGAALDRAIKSLECVHSGTPSGSCESVSDASSEPDNVVATAMNRAFKSLECTDLSTTDGGHEESDLDLDGASSPGSGEGDTVDNALGRAIKSLECLDDTTDDTDRGESDHIADEALGRAMKSLECTSSGGRPNSASGSSAASDKVVASAMDRAIKSSKCTDRPSSASGSSAASDKVVASAMDRAIKSSKCTDRPSSASGSSAASNKVVASAIDRAIKSSECTDRPSSASGSSAASNKVVAAAMDRAIKSSECTDRGASSGSRPCSVGDSSAESDIVVAAAMDRAIKSSECTDRETSSGGRPHSASGSSAASDQVVAAAMDRAIKSAECTDTRLTSAGRGDSDMEGVCDSLIGEMAKACVETVLPPTPVTPSFFTELEIFGPRRDPVFPLDGRNDRPQSDEARPLPSDLRDTVLHTLSNVQTQLDAIRHELRQYGVIPPDRCGGRQ